jgi:hypothetical protein
LLDEEAWCLVVRDPLQLQKQERSNDGEEEKEEEDGHTEEARAAFMSLPLLASSSSSLAIARSAILQFFAKQMKSSKSNCNSNSKKRILRFFDFTRRCGEREREREQLLSNFSESLLSSSSNLLRTSSLGSKLAFTFVCLSVGCCCCNWRSSKIRFVCFVLVCLAQSSVFF